MACIRPISVRRTHERLGAVAATWANGEVPLASRRYAFRRGIAHLLGAERAAEAERLVGDFEYQLARRRSEGADGEGEDIATWCRDLAAVARRAPTREARAWDDFARTNRHLFRKEGWEPWRVLFQAAMDHADDSPVTLGAEAFEASGRRDWAWLRWVNRTKEWRANPCLAVMVGHTNGVSGALGLADGRVLSWSADQSLRLWDGATGSPLATLKGHAAEVSGAVRLPDGRILSWSRDNTLRVWDGMTGGLLAILEGHTC